MSKVIVIIIILVLLPVWFIELTIMDRTYQGGFKWKFKNNSMIIKDVILSIDISIFLYVNYQFMRTFKLKALNLLVPIAIISVDIITMMIIEEMFKREEFKRLGEKEFIKNFLQVFLMVLPVIILIIIIILDIACLCEILLG